MRLSAHTFRNFPQYSPQSRMPSSHNTSSLCIMEEKISLYSCSPKNLAPGCDPE